MQPTTNDYAILHKRATQPVRTGIEHRRQKVGPDIFVSRHHPTFLLNLDGGPLHEVWRIDFLVDALASKAKFCIRVPSLPGLQVSGKSSKQYRCGSAIISGRFSLIDGHFPRKPRESNRMLFFLLPDDCFSCRRMEQVTPRRSFRLQSCRFYG
jgi:hypothetical protein